MPADDDPQSGRYEIRYAIAGIRYTLDSFGRMLYAEWRIDHGDLFNGKPRDSEFTIGFRWDFGD